MKHSSHVIDKPDEVSIQHGSTTTVKLTLQNTGSMAWGEGTRLGTITPRDRASAFYTAAWLAPNRVAAVKGSVLPGQSYTFEFEVSAKTSHAGSFKEDFCLVEEGLSWFEPSSAFTLTFRVGKSESRSNKPASKIMLLSTWKIKCGIAQYCKHLYTALGLAGYECFVAEHTRNYDLIYNTLAGFDFDIFIVQFEPAIIKNIEALFTMIQRLKQETSIRVYFIPHSENNALTRLDGSIDLIYHKAPKLSYSKSSIYRVPMPVPVFSPDQTKAQYRAKYNIPSDSFVISTLGFMFKWKQHSTIIRLLSPLLRKHSNIRLQLLTSYHDLNPAECNEENNKINAEIDRAGIRQQVIHITDYIPQNELNARLYLSDLGWLWSGIETSSSSASLKEFVASRLPVVKTSSSHHHDISTGCITTGTDINDFVSNISRIYYSPDILEGLRQEMEAEYNRLNYTSITKKYTEIFNR